jgi:predicted nucleic acid-binding protein
MRSFIQELQRPTWDVTSLEVADLGRVSDLLEAYQDAELDFADATIVAIAERLNIGIVLTLDRRHFRMIRPKHTDYFTVLP